MQKVEINFTYKNCLQEDIFLIRTKDVIDQKVLDFLSNLGKLKYTLDESYGVFLVDSKDFFITGTRGEKEMKFRVKENMSKTANQLIENFLQRLNNYRGEA